MPKQNIRTDPEIAQLQKTHRALQSRLHALRSELDTASQAQKIETSGKDSELETLIVKWRGVTQDAADEVFEGAKERVVRMGGVAGWKKRQEEQKHKFRDPYEDDFGAGAGVGAADEREVEARKAELMDQYDVNVAADEQHEDGNSVDEEEVCIIHCPCSIPVADLGEQEFTMDMMLKTLNVDLNLIGFDRSNQKWVKE